MKKILIVDDSQEILYLTSRVLQTRGYKVATVSDGNKVIEAINKDWPDLIILDMIMPTKDGTEICKELKKDSFFRTIPIILSTGHMIDENQTPIEEGARPDDFLMKPFDIDDLISKVEKWIK